MKKYIYIGQENGKEVVIEMMRDKPRQTKPHNGHCTCDGCEISRGIWEIYYKEVANAPRIEVIGTIPAYWEKGEEVYVRLQHQWNSSHYPQDHEWWKTVTEKEYEIHRPDRRRKVAIPIDKAVEPEHIADTGKMIEGDDFEQTGSFTCKDENCPHCINEQLEETEDELWKDVIRTPDPGRTLESLISVLKSKFTITRKTKPNE